MAVVNPTIIKPQFTTKLKSINPEVDKLNQLIVDHGVRANLYKTIQCPNVKSIDGGQHNILCNICRHGFVDKDPKETMVFFQNQALNKQFSIEGIWDDQMVAATFLSGAEPHYFCKVELLDFTEPFTERIQRQQGNIDRLTYCIYSIDFLIDQEGKEYKTGKDFQVTSDGDLEWLSANRPITKSVYSVYYNHLIVFRGVDAMHANRWGQTSFKTKDAKPIEYPRQWRLKREQIGDRFDKKGNLLEPNKILS